MLPNATAQTDTLTRDDMQVSQHPAFDAQPDAMKKALRRAAARGTANLPDDIGEGWMMVPSKTGLRQVAFNSERRAWRI